MSGGANMADLGAVQRTLLSLSARMKTLESAVARLSEKPTDHAARGLAEASDRLDVQNPDRVPGNAVAELEARESTGR